MSAKISKNSLLVYLAVFLIFLGSFFVFTLYSNSNDFFDWMLYADNKGEKNKIEDNDQVIEDVFDDSIVLIFGGDIMLSRTVNAKMSTYNNYAWPLQNIASTTRSADITIFNLESPFLEDADYNVPTGSFSFKANPKAINTLTLAGTDVLSLANNHIMNMGKRGLSDTMDILQENNIEFTGAGFNSDEAHQGVIINKNNWRVAFLSYAYPNDNSVADELRPGIATMDKNSLKQDIARLKLSSDLIIVLMHAGLEYKSQPNWEQKDFAHEAIDAGADAVIGHHPHWVQSWEVYKDKPIFYSLGNLVFDQMFSSATSHGLILRVTFKKNSSGKADFLPIQISDFGQADFIYNEDEISSFWDLYNLPKTESLTWSKSSGS